MAGLRYEHNGSADAAIEAAKNRLCDRVTEAIAEDARRYAPVDTGELRGSIQATPAVDGVGHVIATADHASYVELGTYKMDAQPYLRPALYQRRAI